MNVRLLGSGAADGIPALFEDSKVSHKARCSGGRDLRTRCAALIDEALQIDFGPDSFMQLARCGLNPKGWSAIVFTHSHDDHFAPTELQYALYPFTSQEFAHFTIYGNEAICSRIESFYPDWPFEIVRTKSFEPFSHGRYEITPIHAYHKLDEDAHNLIFDDGKTRFLYATDTGFWQEHTWEFLRTQKIDGLVIECTEGNHRTTYYGHMDLKECVKAVKRLRTEGSIADDAPVFTTHHSHLGGLDHEGLERALAPHGIRPGYDGLEFTV